MSQGAAAALSLQPDITLELDFDGVIRGVSLSSSMPAQDADELVGRRWVETVSDPGSAKVLRIVEDASSAGVSGFRQVNQRFPDGLEVPIEYTAVRLGSKGLIAIGKSLQVVAELQSRLNAAQQAIEQDYWRLRDIETRCRLLFDRSTEAVLLVRAANYHVVEANPAATRALGLSRPLPEGGPGRALLADILPEEQASVVAMLDRVRDQGSAPGILIHLGPDRAPWLVRSSVLPSQEGLTYLLQLSPASPASLGEPDDAPIEGLVELFPDAVVVLSAKGTVEHANRAFLDLVQLGDLRSVAGEPIDRWLGRPGAEAKVLLSEVRRTGFIRLFSTSIVGALGTGSEVEVSAAGDRHPEPEHLGLLIRDVGSRLPAGVEGSQIGTALRGFADRVGKSSLPTLVKEAVGELERHYIQTALEMTGGNRTAAAQLLGVSRQSLYAKLNRYGAEEGPPTAELHQVE